MSQSFTHLDDAGQARMVDVGDKAVTRRSATARTRVDFPATVFAQLSEAGFESKKGSIFQVAIIAGIQAVKRTHELIPLCHPLPLDGINVTVEPDGEHSLEVRCTVRTEHRTGVEMEALTGASVAALTLYDMCKALSHEIVLSETRLLEKTGGKADYRHDG